MSKIKFWQFMALLGMTERKKEKETLPQNQAGKVNSFSRKAKHSRSLGQHRYMYLSKRSR